MPASGAPCIGAGPGMTAPGTVAFVPPSLPQAVISAVSVDNAMPLRIAALARSGRTRIGRLPDPPRRSGATHERRTSPSTSATTQPAD
jgi:hypothetical protein